MHNIILCDMISYHVIHSVVQHVIIHYSRRPWRRGAPRLLRHGVQVCTCMCIHIHIHTSLSLSMSTYIYIYIYVCMYIYIYIYTYA